MTEGSPIPETETKRDRVRRLLLDPLGFRWPRGADEAEGRRKLDGIADELAYMDDDRLAALRDLLRGKGEGVARCFWPERATFIGFAELVQPRPIEDLPALLSWFGSVEGPRAIEDGTLVETFEYIRDRKVPPAHEKAAAMIRARATENARRLQLVDDRIRQDLPPRDGEPEWARGYRARRAWCEEIVRIERAKRGLPVAASSSSDKERIR